MNTTNDFHSSTPRPGWQLLGKLELSAVSTSDTISTWLKELVIPLNLQSDFTQQLLNSAQDATLRALDPNSTPSFEHVHISVFTPNRSMVHNNAWGFFRIEKIDGTESNNDHPDHTVEFYLYLEGQ